MHKILIPVGDIEIAKMIPFCNHFNCTVRYQDKSQIYFEILSDDPVNFFWLGMNLNLKIDTGLSISAASKYLNQ